MLWITPILLFHYVSGIYVSQLQQKVRNHLYLLLEKTTKLLDKCNVQYFINGGTLLGAVRERGIISHDDDLDIGVLSGTIENPRFLRELEDEHDLYFKKASGEGDRLAHRIYLKATPKMDVFMDIFEYATHDGVYSLACPQQKQLWPTDWFREEDLFPLQKYEFGTRTVVWGPCNPIPYLERLYGEEGAWKTPICTHIHLDQIVKKWGILDYIFIYYQKYIGKSIDHFLFHPYPRDYTTPRTI